MHVTSAAEQLLFTTVRIETRKNNVSGCGTGFIFRMPLANEESADFLVTNKHVVNEFSGGTLTFFQTENDEPKLGNSHTLDVTEGFDNLWYGHPDPSIDVAVTPLVPLLQAINYQGKGLYYKVVSTDNLPSEETESNLDALEEVVFIGYPNGIWDSKNLLPIMRKGTTATPITVDFEGQKKFLIDASVFPGSSGSPVFIYNSGSFTTKTGSTVFGRRLHFIGIIAQVFVKKEFHEVRSIPIPTSATQFTIGEQMIDLGIVFKASCITETINHFLREKHPNLLQTPQT